MDTSRKLKHTCSHTLIFNNAMLLYHCPSERIFTILHVHASLAATVIKLKWHPWTTTTQQSKNGAFAVYTCSIEAVKQESREHLIFNRLSTLFTWCPHNLSLETSNREHTNQKEKVCKYIKNIQNHFLFTSASKQKKTSGRLWWNSFNEIKDCADFPTKLKWNVWPVTYCKSLKQQNEHHFLCQYTDGLPLPLVLQCFVTSVSGSLRTLPNLCPFFIKNQH